MQIKAQRQAFSIALIYIIVAAAWILCSDVLVGKMIRNPDDRLHLSMLKGWLFVAVTGGCLFLVLRRVLRRWEQEVERRRLAEAGQREVAEKLRLKEEQLRLVIEGSADGLWDWDLRSGIVDLSPRYWELSGYPAGEAVGNLEFLKKLVHPEDWPAVQAAVNELLTGKAAHSVIEYRIITLAGAEKWVWGRGKVVARDANGRPLRMAGTVSDITLRKHAELALRESQALYRSLVTQLPIGIFQKDQVGRYVLVNPAFCRLRGRAATDFLGKTPQAVAAATAGAQADSAELVAKYAAAGEDHHRLIMANGTPIEVDEEYTLADGRKHFEHTIKLPVVEPGGKVIGTQGVVFDITERKRAEEALRLSQERYVLTERAVNDGLWDWNLLTDDDFFSPRWKAIVGYQDDELPNLKAFFLNLVHPDDLPVVQAVTRDHLTAGKPYHLEYRLRHKDGSYRWVFSRGEAVRDAAGRPMRMFGAVTDITERKQAEAALRDSEAKYRNLFTSSRDAIMTLDPADNGRFTSGNPATLAFFGAADEAEFCARNPLNLSPPQQSDGRVSSEKAKEMMTIALDVGSHLFEWTHRRLNGEVFPAEVRLHRMELDGKMLLQATVRDITERKQMEAEIRRVSQWLFHTQRISRVGGWTINLVTGAVWISPEAARIYGISPADSLNLAAIQAFPLPQYRALLDAAMGDLVAGRAAYDLEFQIVRGSDHAIVDIHSVAEYHPEETLVLGVIEDVTGRKLVEASQAQLATVVEQCAETIVVTDLQGVIIYANPAFEKTTGYTRAEALGQHTRLLKSGQQPAAFYREMWAALKRGEVWHGHFINRRKDRTLYEEDATITPVRNAAGTIVSYAAVKRDVTREVQLEDQLRQSQKLEGIGQLAGGVAHDFNNILSSLIMQTELVELTVQLSADAVEGLRQIRADANRAADLTRQLLLFSRRQVMQSRDLDLNDVVMNLVKMLRRIIGEDVHLQLNLHSQPLLTHADAGMLDQVLMNLAVNARDAMPQGGQLRIDTAEKLIDASIAGLYPDAAPGRYVCLRVSDTGGGILPDVMPHIFEPFFTTKAAGKGTGLGLATVFGIVKQHCGWIKLDNQPGRGVTFEVFIPAIDAVAADPGNVAPVVTLRGGTETILLVEDELSVRAPARIILKRQGYQVLEAEHGVEALGLWRQQHENIALLLTDLVMPGGLSGQELARQLVADQPKLRVIYMSGYSPEIAGRELKLKPGENYIQKPFTTNQLLLIVRQCLDVSHA